MALEDLVGMPASQVFQGLLLPILIIFTIIWAILNAVGVFGRKVNTLLAAALTLMTVATPQFSLFTTYLAQLGAQVAIAAFFAVFALGTVAWALGRGRDIVYEQTGMSKDRINKELAKHYRKYKEARKARDPGKMKAEMDEIKRLEIDRDTED